MELAAYNKTDDVTLLNEYYKQTKPHLNSEEIAFLMEASFKVNEDIDEERDIKKKKQLSNIFEKKR